MNCSCRRALTKSLVDQGIYEQGFQEGVRATKEASRLQHYDIYQQGFKAGRASLKDLLKEVSFSGVEHDDERLGYVTVQIARWLWEAIRKEIKE